MDYILINFTAILKCFVCHNTGMIVDRCRKENNISNSVECTTVESNDLNYLYTMRSEIESRYEKE